MYISDLDEGIQCLLRNFADDAALRGEADTAECCVAIQKNPNRLKKSAGMNVFKFKKKGKQKILYAGWNNGMHQYRLDADLLENNSAKGPEGSSGQQVDLTRINHYVAL